MHRIVHGYDWQRTSGRDIVELETWVFTMCSKAAIICQALFEYFEGSSWRDGSYNGGNVVICNAASPFCTALDSLSTHGSQEQADGAILDIFL